MSTLQPPWHVPRIYTTHGLRDIQLHDPYLSECPGSVPLWRSLEEDMKYLMSSTVQSHHNIYVVCGA